MDALRGSPGATTYVEDRHDVKLQKPLVSRPILQGMRLENELVLSVLQSILQGGHNAEKALKVHIVLGRILKKASKCIRI